jgi:glycosyltransferase involved in cell wall biosynthesis
MGACMSLADPCPSEVKVSVLMITYNHEPYIAQAIESVLMQQTSFEYELVIGEDCSTDRTREIVVAYAKKCPDRIRPLLHEQNLGLMGKNNVVATYHACRGKYIALLEGDDYWTDPLKLQKQVDFLDNHPVCSICAHNTKIIGSNKDIPRRTFLPENLETDITRGQEVIFELPTLLQRIFFHTSSCIFKNGLITDFPEFLFLLPGLDYGFFVLLACFGKIGYVNDVMSVYRNDSNGLWNRLNQKSQLSSNLNEYQILYENLGAEYQPLIIQTAIRLIWESAEMFLIKNYNKGLSIPILEKEAGDFLNSILNKKNNNNNEYYDILQRKYFSSFYASLGFLLFKDNHLSSARNKLIMASFHDISWLVNRGFWSILLESIMGKKATNVLRRIFKTLNNRWIMLKG